VLKTTVHLSFVIVWSSKHNLCSEATIYCQGKK